MLIMNQDNGLINSPKTDLYLILLFFLLLISSNVGAQNASDKNKIKVPSEWIGKLRNYDYKQNNLTLLTEFESFIKPDSLEGSQLYSSEVGGMLYPMFVNLDNDEADELIGLFGWSEEYPTLAVFKLIGVDWYIIHLEPFYMFYSSPELQVANNFSVNKLFYIRWLYERGAGVYCDAYHFYKVINNEVYPCLTLINRAYILGWGLYLNQEVEMKFSLNSVSADELWVKYNYNFFPGAVYLDDMPWEDHEEISFVKGEKGLTYYWDSTTYTYQPRIYNSPDDLNKEKIACFGAFGNDTLFVKAFDNETKQTLNNGTSEQKMLLQKYLDIVEFEHKAIAPTGELEEKTKIGGLKFYGTKQKE